MTTPLPRKSLQETSAGHPLADLAPTRSASPTTSAEPQVRLDRGGLQPAARAPSGDPALRPRRSLSARSAQDAGAAPLGGGAGGKERAVGRQSPDLQRRLGASPTGDLPSPSGSIAAPLSTPTESQVRRSGDLPDVQGGPVTPFEAASAMEQGQAHGPQQDTAAASRTSSLQQVFAGMRGLASNLSAPLASTPGVPFAARAARQASATFAAALSNVTAGLDDRVYRGESGLAKKTATFNALGPLYSSSEATIAAPKTKGEMRQSIYHAMSVPGDGALVARVPAGAGLAELDTVLEPARPVVVKLARNQCKAFQSRLDSANRVLAELSKGEGRASRQALHDLTRAKLKSDQFKLSKLAMSASASHRDRQIARVQGSNEALVEHGLSTLNLAHEAHAYGRTVGGDTYGLAVGAPAVGDPALHRNLDALRTAQDRSRALLQNFAATYQSFLTNDLGCPAATLAKLRPKIDSVANRDTPPAQRNKDHAEIMARVIADKRIDAALEAISDPDDRTAITAAMERLAADPEALIADRPIQKFVAELCGDADLGARPGAREFLQAIADQKGAPLDETLRVSLQIQRAEYVPPKAPGREDPVADWKDNRAKDIEKLDAELTSIALHVRMADKLGSLDARLNELFPAQAGGASADIKRNFGRSLATLLDRQPGQPVTAQDKLNIKLAKCILDHGGKVKDIAAQLKYCQESYAGDLGNSPEMMKLLQSGATGASYDLNEQRANAKTRLTNLQMAIADATQQPVEASPQGAPESPQAQFDRALRQADGLLNDPAASLTQAQRDALETHAFLARNYVRTENAADPRELLRQLGDNDPRCGTDAFLSRNFTAYASPSITFGANLGKGTVYGGVDGSYARQFASRRDALPANIMLTESTAYSIKSICRLQMTSTAWALKGSLAGGGGRPPPKTAQDTPSPAEENFFKHAASVAGNLGASVERTVLDASEPGLACLVHKSPVLDGTAKNGKVSNATYVEMNDAVNRALFSKPAVTDVETVPNDDIPGWDNLNQFLAATDRASLELLTTKKEVNVTLSVPGGVSFGGAHSNAFGDDPADRQAGDSRFTVAFREAAGVEGKTSHSFREETLVTSSTLSKVTTSDTLSATLSGSAGATARWGGSISLGDGKHAPAVRISTSTDLAKLSRAIERHREYTEAYQRVVRDQFGNEIPALVRDSRTATDGRLLVDNIVKELGLVNATIAQRIDEQFDADTGETRMSPLEKQTLTQLLLISAVASHFENAGVLGDAQPRNENLTINVTAALTPAAAARHAAVKAGFGHAPDGADAQSLQDGILTNSLNYSTLGGAGGFKNQDVGKQVFLWNATNTRTTSSAQSAGYPSGVGLPTKAQAEAFQQFLARPENRDMRDALDSVGLAQPVHLLTAYEALQQAAREEPFDANAVSGWDIGDGQMPRAARPDRSLASLLAPSGR